MKPGLSLCPTPGCGGRKLTFHTMCAICWSRLPGDYRARILTARRSRARHLEAKAAIEASDWLVRHAPAVEAARRAGEAVPP